MHNNLGMVYARQERIEQARASFEETLRLAPRHVLALENLGSVLAMLGRYEEAEQRFLQALRIDPESVLAGIERFGSHDWYWEGAIQLLLRLRNLKTFWSYDQGHVGSTAWAVLFLKRATLPAVITPR